MRDAIRPDEQHARAVYARGYRTWSSLFTMASKDARLVPDCLMHIQNAFPNHPYFPQGLDVDDSFTSFAVIKGKTTWVTSQEIQHQPAFQDEVFFDAAWDKRITVFLTSDEKKSTSILPDIFGAKNNHMPILMLAWAYILSARWTEIIPDAYLSVYEIEQNADGDSGLKNGQYTKDPIFVNVGQVNKDASFWWHSILAIGSYWDASMRSSKGKLLYCPWSIKLVSELPFAISSDVRITHLFTKYKPPSAAVAYSYLLDYCDLHQIDDQNRAALAGALLIPAAKYDGTRVELALPSILPQTMSENIQRRSPSKIDQHQLTKLLTLSCNPRGVKGLLGSIFFEPDITCNVCGIWLQSSFAFLDTLKDPHVLLQTFMKRNPDLGFLWLGAFVTGTNRRCLQDARGAWWKTDLSSAAWTGVFTSFIQAPVLALAPGAKEISRADECKLLFLCHEIDYNIPPLLPFPPFGHTVLKDTNLEVREHALCGSDHWLGCTTFSWVCKDGVQIKQGNEDCPIFATRSRNWSPVNHDHENEVDIDFDDMDSEDENSESVTRNIFTWLRGQDGFPVAEREIREHEWIDNLDDDDDSPIKGDLCSTVECNLHGWLLGTLTKRCDSI